LIHGLADLLSVFINNAPVGTLPFVGGISGCFIELRHELTACLDEGRVRFYGDTCAYPLHELARLGGQGGRPRELLVSLHDRRDEIISLGRRSPGCLLKEVLSEELGSLARHHRRESLVPPVLQAHLETHLLLQADQLHFLLATALLEPPLES